MSRGHLSIDDEIDLLQLIQPIISHWKLLLKLFVLGIILGFFYTFSLPKYYYSQVSFFLNEGSSSMQLPKGNPYLNLLGGGGSSGGQFKAMFQTLFESRKFKMLIAKDFQERNLILKNLTLEEKGSVHVLSFKHTDAKTSFLVLQSALKNLEKLNEDLELGSERQVIKVLDEAIIPSSTDKRPFSIYSLIGSTVFFISGVFFVFIRDFLFRKPS